MGSEKFSSLRKTYKVLRSGKSVPRHNYTFRIDAEKIENTISFLQESLQLKPGCTRNVKVGGHLFKNIPVYIRGGITAQYLFDTYVDSVGQDKHVGRTTFFELTNLLTKRGEIKAGLSTYYIQLRDSSKLFLAMMMTIQKHIEFESSVKDKMWADPEKLIDEWKSHEQFML